MKKNILVFGYGDLAQRLRLFVNKDLYELFGVSRTNKEPELKNHISWNWLSKDNPKLNAKDFDTIIFIPKPSSFEEEGYIDGFIESSENIYKSIKGISFKRFISISSTRVYGKDKQNIHFESDDPMPDDFRGKIIKQYELNQIKRYSDKLIILRLSGLYDSLPDKNFINYLKRDNASKIINFFIESGFNFKSHEIFNCSEDRNDDKGNISNTKLKEIGFIFA